MRTVLPLSTLCLLAAPFLASAREWTPLLQGDTKTGWRQLGGKATYEIKDGVVIGTSVPKEPNSFLATEKNYGDFILEYEFSVADDLNSGVQIRSNSLPSYKNGQVHGYQVEIDADKPDRKWTGGIYEEGRRGWLFDLTNSPEAQNATKRGGEWNKVRVEALGPRIKTFINGVACADLVDSFTEKGFIALQVHGVGNDAAKIGKQAKWRNLRIQDLGCSAWTPVFPEGKADGWTATKGGKWEFLNGVLTGTSPAADPNHGIFLSEKNYADFAIRFKFRVTKGDSGFYFRAEPSKDAVAVHGFQAEVDASQETGGLYETSGRAWVVQTVPAKVSEVYQPGEWAEMSVTCLGNRTVVNVWRWTEKGDLKWIKTADLTDDKGRKDGRLGFQLHGGMDMQVEFKDVELLTPAADK